MVWFLDYSADELSGSTVKSAGYGGAIRYIDEPARMGRKHTSKVEYESYKNAGLDMYLVMEVDTTDAWGGFARGKELATRAKKGADYIGYDGVIFFCNDNPTLSPRWKEYLNGAASVIGWDRMGAYGFANAMDVARQTKCVAFWQAGRRSDVRPFVNFWQDNNNLDKIRVGHISCDRDLLLRPMPKGGEDEVSWETKLQDGTWHPGGDRTARHAMAYIHQIAQRNANLSDQVDQLRQAVADLALKVESVGTVSPDVDEVALAQALIAAGLNGGLSKEEAEQAVIEALRTQFNK